MKNKIIMLICATVFAFGTISAQKITTDKVPAPVASAFKAKFPTADKTSWRMEDGKNYAADFKSNNIMQSATFNATGGWIQTDTQIKTTEIPAPVKETVAKQFAGYTITSASRMMNSDHASGFDLALAKGTQTMNVVLNSKGAVMSQDPAKSNSTSAAAPKTN